MNGTLKLYRLSQTESGGYNTYDSCVVIAQNADEAARIHPNGFWEERAGTWATSSENVTAEYLGEAAPHMVKGVVVASFNAAG